MWNAVSGILKKVTGYLFPGGKRKSSDSDLGNDFVGLAPKRGRFIQEEQEIMDRGRERWKDARNHNVTYESSSSMINNVSDDDSDVEIIERDNGPIQTEDAHRNVIDIEARDNYAKLLRERTPVYSELPSRNRNRYSYGTHPQKQALRSFLFTSPSSVTTPIGKHQNGVNIQHSYQETKAKLDEMVYVNEISPMDVRRTGLDLKTPTVPLIDLAEGIQPSEGTLSTASGLNYDDKFTSGRPSFTSKYQQDLVSADCISLAETRSDASLSRTESPMQSLKRCTSLEQLDQLCTRSPLADLNDKFSRCDPTSLRMSLARNSKAKTHRKENIAKLEIETNLRREARLAARKSVEDGIRLQLRLEGLLLDEVVVKDEFPALDDDQVQKVKVAIGPGCADDRLADLLDCQVTRKDLRTLVGLNWLNDEVVNFYFSMLMERGGNDGLPRVYSMNTFFYPKLLQSGHQALKRWTRRIDIFSYDMILVPVHLDVHWCLAVIDFRSKMIKYFDSMGGENDKCLRALLQYLKDELLDKKQQDMDVSDWTLCYEEDIPMQLNGSDCGVFTCQFAERISRDGKISFTQENMPYFRRRMIYEILTSRLM